LPASGSKAEGKLALVLLYLKDQQQQLKKKKKASSWRGTEESREC